MTPLIIGSLLALLGLLFVLVPIFVGVPARRGSAARTVEPVRDGAIDALREIEFDRATGKLSDSDYAELKHSYTDRALTELRLADSRAARGAGPGGDPVEAVLAAYRQQHPRCSVHGLRPEDDALYCGECGRYLTGACASCGAAVEERAARFCAACGSALAA
jgi:hypothetical protein